MRKLSKVEAGKLGSIKSIETQQAQKQERIDFYMSDPKKCKQCDSILEYEDRNKTFCNSSCSASYNNAKREKNPIVTYECLNCKKENIYSNQKYNKYCNITCQKEYEHKQRIVEWQEGGTIGKGPLKRYLAEQKEGCWECGITEWNGKDIVLELEHINGNSSDNTEENVSLLCPNCHSQTPTYKAKNKGNGRHYRRQRYQEGLSY